MSLGLIEHSLDHLGSKKGDAAPSDGWLITFADLLTLVLCFFVATMRLGPIGRSALPDPRWTGGATLADKPPSQKTGEPEVGIPKDGTALALTTNEPRVSEFRILPNDLADSGGGIRAELLEKVKTAVNAVGYSKKTVRIQTCAEGESADSGPEWFGSLGRVSAIRSQVIDTGVAPTKVELQVLGPHCELIRSNEQADQTIAKITVINELESNG